MLLHCIHDPSRISLCTEDQLEKQRKSRRNSRAIGVGIFLITEDPAMREFAEELLSYSDTFNRAVLFSLKGESLNEISSAVNYLETALAKFSDGPFFLGQFSLVDIAYAPFVERFHPLLLEVKNYDITTGRPMLRSWIENMNKIEAYKQTKRDPQELVAVLKKRFSHWRHVLNNIQCAFTVRVLNEDDMLLRSIPRRDTLSQPSSSSSPLGSSDFQFGSFNKIAWMWMNGKSSLFGCR